jgi:hypothetical protein
MACRSSESNGLGLEISQFARFRFAFAVSYHLQNPIKDQAKAAVHRQAEVDLEWNMADRRWQKRQQQEVHHVPRQNHRQGMKEVRCRFRHGGRLPGFGFGAKSENVHYHLWADLCSGARTRDVSCHLERIRARSKTQDSAFHLERSEWTRLRVRSWSRKTCCLRRHQRPKS